LYKQYKNKWFSSVSYYPSVCSERWSIYFLYFDFIYTIVIYTKIKIIKFYILLSISILFQGKKIRKFRKFLLQHWTRMLMKSTTLIDTKRVDVSKLQHSYISDVNKHGGESKSCIRVAKLQYQCTQMGLKHIWHKTN
jgi:hypothetical protein